MSDIKPRISASEIIDFAKTQGVSMNNLNPSKRIQEKHLQILSHFPLFHADEDDCFEPPTDHFQIVTDYELGMQ